jgi:hypothetical protein
MSTLHLLHYIIRETCHRYVVGPSDFSATVRTIAFYPGSTTL